MSAHCPGPCCVETYHQPPVNLPHERNLSRIRLRHAPRIVCVAIPAGDGLDALQIGLLIVVSRAFLALDDGLGILSRHGGELLFPCQEMAVFEEEKEEEEVQVGVWAKEKKATRELTSLTLSVSPQRV